MNRTIFLGLLAGIAACLVARNRIQPTVRIVPVEKAAATLQQAWADHHTIA